jgi:hypothetical protein
MSEIHPLAVFIAALVGYFVGWTWYSPLLWQKPWMAALGKTQTEWDEVGKKEMPKTIAYGFATTLAISFALAVFLNVIGVSTLLEAVQLGLLLCFSFVVTTKFTDMIYASPPPHWGRRAQQLFLIDAGYQILLFILLSAIIWKLSV